MTKPTLVFDVNETLLDLEHMTPLFTRVFGQGETMGANVMREWFAQLILYSQTVTLSGIYTPFGDLAVGAFQMIAELHGVKPTPDDVAELVTRITHMPVLPDVIPALEKWRAAEFTMVTLTNSSSPIALQNAGIADMFDRHFSVDVVGRFKPAPECYQLVAEGMGAKPADLILIASHLWDTIGAQAAGCQSALITRDGNTVMHAKNVPQPNYVASDLGELAELLSE